MKFALADGLRQEAQPDLIAVCLGCGNPVVAKCGEIRIWHWAHRGKRACNLLWENETEWHRGWKNRFPTEWQEVVHQAEDGEKHIADVKTDQGWVIEFQHSHIKPEERRARSNFYPKLAWVVDGTRRLGDKKRFIDTLKNGMRVNPKINLFKVFSDHNALLREWDDTHGPVFFDFGEGPALWWLLPKSPNGKREYVAAFSRAEFIEIHGGGLSQNVLNFETFLKDFSDLVKKRSQRRF